MNASDRAFEIWKELGESALIRLDGFDSELIAVVTNSGINLVQSWDEELHHEVFLPEDCYKGLLKILQEKVNGN